MQADQSDRGADRKGIENKMLLYKHKKTGNIYRQLAIATDCTNSRDGVVVVVYCPDDNGHTIYVREQAEFDEKFELCGSAAPGNKNKRDQ